MLPLYKRFNFFLVESLKGMDEISLPMSVNFNTALGYQAKPSHALKAIFHAQASLSSVAVLRGDEILNLLGVLPIISGTLLEFFEPCRLGTYIRLYKWRTRRICGDCLTLEESRLSIHPLTGLAPIIWFSIRITGTMLLLLLLAQPRINMSSCLAP